MNIDATINLLTHGNQLKRTVRTGWGQRGVPNPENVATHSFGVVFTAYVLTQVIDEPLDLGRVLAIAALHDLPESLTTDIPTPAWRFLPAGIKSEVERGAMQEILAGAGFAAATMALWEELHAGETAESRLVDDADKLDMFLQAIMYQKQTGNRQLGQFWDRPYRCHFAESQAIYDTLRAQWENVLVGKQTPRTTCDIIHL